VRGEEGGGSERFRRLPESVQRLADVGSSEADSDDVRLRKRVLNLAAALMATLSPIWVTTYLALGLWPSAAIPLVYILATAALMYWNSRTPSYGPFRFVELVMMLVMPFALQWSLGGFANSSVVSLWALTSPLGAIFFIGARQALPWFGGFAALIGVSALLDPALSDGAPEIPEAVVVAFFALNVFAVSATVFLIVQYFVRAREKEQARSERLLLNVLPEPVARRLKRSEGVIADSYPEATVLFADIVDFTILAKEMTPEQLVRLLDRVFTGWDELASRHGLEKIKTIGDEYMVVGGVPEARPDHASAVARMALEMSTELAERTAGERAPLRARVGIDTGPVVAGVIGRSKFIYDLWGDTVNTASRMESTGEVGRIQVTERMYRRLGDAFLLHSRGEIEIKGKGRMRTYFLDQRAADAPGQPSRMGEMPRASG
jgi:class 3 adenylate cyclase